MKKLLTGFISIVLVVVFSFSTNALGVETKELVWNENGYESLVQSEEFKEIKQLEKQILNLARSHMVSIDMNETIDAEDIHYQDAYKFYIASPLQLSEGTIEQDLTRADYVWKIPVPIEKGTLVVSCIRNEISEKNKNGLMTDEFYQKILNKEVYWQVSSAEYYADSAEYPTKVFSNALISNDKQTHKIFFGDFYKSRGLYGITVENGVPAKMVPIEGFTAVGTERITARMKSAGDFQDGQVYTYSDFTDRMSRVEPNDPDTATIGVGGGGLITNPTEEKVSGIKPEGIVLLVMIAAFLLTTGGILVYQKVKDRVR